MVFIITMVVLFPFAGWLSDVYGRKMVMTSGALGIFFFSPFAMNVISQGTFVPVAMTQLFLGIFLGMHGAPMCSWMAESFSPKSRLTSLALGYNVSGDLVGPRISSAGSRNFAIIICCCFIGRSASGSK
jgi:MFS family permease